MKYAALVIGINNYEHNNKLDNAVNDAELIADVFNTLKYDVTLLRDNEATKKGVDDAIDEIIDKDYTENYDAIILYFSGHGFMTDAYDCLALQDAKHIEYHGGVSAMEYSIVLDSFCNKFRRRGTPVIVVIMDACRDDISDYADAPNGIEKPRGVGDIMVSHFGTAGNAPFQTFLAFSTSPNKHASDGGRGEKNSKYTSALVDELLKPIPIEEVFKNVRRKVYTDSKCQLPWENSCLVDSIYFNYGQLDPYYGKKYRKECYIWKGYYSFSSLWQRIIDGIKSVKEDEVLNSISILSSQRNLASHDDLFVAGRAMMNSAIKGSESASDYIARIDLDIFQRGKDNDFVNGLLYELYYDESNNFSQKHIKSTYLLDSLSRFSQKDFCVSSVDFINNVLEYEKRNVSYHIGNRLVHNVRVSLEMSNFSTIRGEQIFTIRDIKHHDVSILPNFELFRNYTQAQLRMAIVEYLQIPSQQVIVKFSLDATNGWILPAALPDDWYDRLSHGIEMGFFEEIDALGWHGYVVQDIGDYLLDGVEVTSSHVIVTGRISASFDINLDEGDTFNMSFPGKFQFILSYDGCEWIVIDKNIGFDTSDFCDEYK